MKTMKLQKPVRFEYLRAVDPRLPEVPIRSFPASTHLTGPSRVVHLDNSKELMTDYPASSPNCLASFVRLKPCTILTSNVQASSHLFYVLRGRGVIVTSRGLVTWADGDVITLPAYESITFQVSSESALYWVNDSPLLRYLGVQSTIPTFNPVRYEARWLQNEVRRVAREAGALKRNRIGILLDNPACTLTRTVTPVMWLLLQIIPPGMILPPHRHNSVALNLAISGCNRGYTLMGRELDARRNIRSPVRVDWADGSAFTTPPMFWHEHHNDGLEEAWLLPVQDAGLVTYGRILDLRFAAGGPKPLAASKVTQSKLRQESRRG